MRGISKPALLVMAFAPAGSQIDNHSRAYLECLWRACLSLGMTAPLPGLAVPADRIGFESAQDTDSGFRLLAAARRPDARTVHSCFVFAERDVIGFVALLAPNDTRGGLRQWRELLAEWNDAVALAGPPPQPWGMLGQFQVFEVLHSRGPVDYRRSLCEEIRRNAPDGGANGSDPWWNGFDRTEHGFSVWRQQGGEEPDSVTRFYVLSPDSEEDALDEWAWAADGRHRLRPFARYLLHASKIRYQAQRYEASPSLHATVEESDRQATALLEELTATSGNSAPIEGVLRTAALLDGTQLRPQGLLWTITRLRQLSSSLSADASNMRLHTPGVRRHGPGPSWPERDRAHAEWLIRQVDDDRLHLEAARERAEAVRAAATAATERALADHRSLLTLIQTSVLGSVLTALTAAQAMSGLPLPGPLQPPVIAVLAALALALPLVVLRWTSAASGMRRYRSLDYGLAGLAAASLGWLAVTGWETASGHGPPSVARTLLGAAVTAAIALVTVNRLVRPRRL